MFFNKFDDSFVEAVKNSEKRQIAIKSYSVVRITTFIVGILAFLFGLISSENSNSSFIIGIVFLMITFSYDVQIKLLKLNNIQKK
jgi:uncharacterized membrane protein YiaA